MFQFVVGIDLCEENGLSGSRSGTLGRSRVCRISTRTSTVQVERERERERSIGQEEMRCQFQIGDSRDYRLSSSIGP